VELTAQRVAKVSLSLRSLAFPAVFSSGTYQTLELKLLTTGEPVKEGMNYASDGPFV